MNSLIPLRKKLDTELCFEKPKHPFLAEITAVTLVTISGYTALLTFSSTTIQMIALVCIAFAMVQAGFIAHEASHCGIASTKDRNDKIGQFFLTFLTGVSYSLFCHIHQRHHVNPAPKVHQDYGGTLKLYDSVQMRVPVSLHTATLWLISIFRSYGFHVESILYVLSHNKQTRRERVILSAHYTLWLILPLISLDVIDVLLNYLLLNLFSGLYIGPLLLFSHTGLKRESSTFGEHCITRQSTILSSTRNIINSNILEIIFKGTREHIEHHLFPNIPYKHLRKSKIIIHDYCQKHNLEYNEVNLLKALREVTR